MTFKNAVRFAIFSTLVIGVSKASANDINETLYLESKTKVKLYKAAILKNGDRALAPQVEIPEESIVAIDLSNASKALTASKDSPERVNFPFVTSPDDTKIQRNNTGWMCGLRVVDVNDEDLREDNAIDGSDFCMSLENIKNVKALDSNGEMTLKSYERFAQTGDLSMLNSLANELEALTRLREMNPEFMPIRNTSQIISPLKNCGKGCLASTSEYGYRIHPVLKKRRLHKGIDLRAATGTKVVSVFKGQILANRSEKTKGGKLKGYGHYVIVVHPEAKMETLYAHLSSFKSKSGAAVNQGQEIALSGATGIGTGPHLHFETHPYDGKTYQLANPRTYIGHMLAKLASILKSFMFHV